MGCAASSPRVNPAQRQKPINPINLNDDEEVEKPPAEQIVKAADLTKFFRDSIVEINQGISKIPSGKGETPLVVLDKNSCPLVTSSLCLERGDTTNISLPIAAISAYGKGRAVILSSINILANCVNSDTESSAFLENIVQWVSGPGRISYRILLIL